MTKAEFLTSYELQFKVMYDWASNETKLTRYMSAVASTISGINHEWNHDGEAVTAAWRAIGGKGKPTLKALRALL